MTVLAPLPPVIIANLAVRDRWARYANLAIAGGAVALVGASSLYNLAAALAGAGHPVPPAIGLFTALLSALVLSRTVRERLARLIPLDPDSPVGLLALVGVILVIGTQAEYQAGHDALSAVSQAPALQPIDVLAGEIPLLLLALFGVGLFTRRPPGAVLARLGLLRPVTWQVLASLGFAGAFYAVSQLGDQLQQALDPELTRRLHEATSHYYAGFNTSGLGGVIAIAVIAIAPGIAEETLFRGALQPRLGLLLAAVAFASVHTQYAITVDTLLVFTLGLGLGLIRRYLNTTCAVLTHATYNALAGFGVAIPLLGWATTLDAVLLLSAAGLWWAGRAADPAGPGATP